MPRRKADPSIGRRAFEEVYNLADTLPAASKLLGADRKLLYSWHHGATPEVFYLVKLHDLGADILYILTGQRRTEAMQTWG